MVLKSVSRDKSVWFQKHILKVKRISEVKYISGTKEEEKITLALSQGDFYLT